LECIRADDLPAGSDSIREKVHSCIENAALVIADVSDSTPNIYYEIGYAAASRRPMIPIAAEGKEIPSDLKGIETIRYNGSRDGLTQFEMELKRHLAVHADSNISLLRAMIVPPEPRPSYLLASPKLPVANSQFKFHEVERRTFGDNLGIVGILSAFASVFNEYCVPELLSAKHAPEDVMTWDANLFLIGSPKVNPHTRVFMKALQASTSSSWHFERCPNDDAPEDYEMILTGGENDGAPFRSPCLHQVTARPIRHEDHGLFMRGPHPRFPARTVTILAGSHSLGTGAAALAATRSPLIREIAKRLEGQVELTRRDMTIWALVRGNADEDHHLRQEGVEVLGAGICEPAS
jgi:hypothetical protein